MNETREEKVLREATVCFLVRGSKVLLALKTDKIGKGKRNGYGGGVEFGETIVACALRELYEETGGVVAKANDLEKIAVVHFHNTKSDGTSFVCTVHFFVVHDWLGEPQATIEMSDPQWFDVSGLPLDDMMPADRQWLPQALAGQKLIATAYLGPYQEHTLGDVEITYADSFFDERTASDV